MPNCSRCATQCDIFTDNAPQTPPKKLNHKPFECAFCECQWSKCTNAHNEHIYRKLMAYTTTSPKVLSSQPSASSAQTHKHSTSYLNHRSANATSHQRNLQGIQMRVLGKRIWFNPVVVQIGRHVLCRDPLLDLVREPAKHATRLGIGSEI